MGGLYQGQEDGGQQGQEGLGFGLGQGMRGQAVQANKEGFAEVCGGN